MIKVTKQWINSHKTPKGAWTKAQIHALGLEWPPRSGWMDAIEGTLISKSCALLFQKANTTKAGSTKTHGVSITLDSAFNIVVNGFSKLNDKQLDTLEQLIRNKPKG